MQFTASVVALALASVVTAADPDIMKYLQNNKDLSTLKGLIDDIPELQKNLGMAMNITVLAPSNAAIEKFMKTDTYKGFNDDAKMAWLEYHVLQGTFPSSGISETPIFYDTMIGNYTPFNNKDTEYQVVKAIKNKDGAKFYGGANMGAKVTKADVAFDGGVLHLLDSVLNPPMTVSETAKELKLVGIVEALNATKLVEKVDMMPHTTILVPSNEAFMAMQDMLKKMKPEDVAKVLQYHIIPDVVFSTGVVSDITVKTANGEKLTLRNANGTIYANDKQVIIPDVITNSGVIHVIDGILSPMESMAKPNKTILDTVSAAAAEKNTTSVDSGVSKSMISGVLVSVVVGIVGLFVIA